MAAILSRVIFKLKLIFAMVVLNSRAMFHECCFYTFCVILFRDKQAIMQGSEAIIA